MTNGARHLEDHTFDMPLRLTTMERLGNPFITAGDRLYVIGAQDGSFPRHGWHIPGEMGGVWAHPIKLADGYALAVDGTWVPPAHTFQSEVMRAVYRSSLNDGLEVERSQWVPDDHPYVVIRYDLRSPVDRRVTLRFAVAFNFCPVWPIPESLGSDPAASTTHFDPELGAWVYQHTAEPWCAIVGCRTDRPLRWSAERPDIPASVVPSDGLWATLDFSVQLLAEQSRLIEFVLGGGSENCESVTRGYRDVCARSSDLHAAKIRRYNTMLSHSHVGIPDQAIATAWDWLKANNDWLVRDVPGVGRGLGAGGADFVWWFGCDTAYATLGCLALGQHEIAVETIDLIRNLSERANEGSGQVLHEANTRGEVVHPGLTQETPHLTAVTWDVFRWTADRAFLERMYPFCRKGVLEWTLGECRRIDEHSRAPGGLLPYGYGITEVEGMDLQCIDSAVHTIKALQALQEMASVVGDTDTADRCASLAPELQAAMEQAFWMEDEGLYGDMVATPREMVGRLERWIRVAEESDLGTRRQALVTLLAEAQHDPSPDAKRPWFLGHWVVICPMAAGLTATNRADRAFNRIEGPEFSGPYGMYLDALARTQSMSINTGVLAGTEFRYGRADQGLTYLRQIAATLPLHMPGAISEYLPDEGCFVQAWSGYALAWPLVVYAFGLQPDAHERRIRIEPHFPSGWEGASLRNVRVGETAVDLVWDGRGMAVTIHESGWTVVSDSVPLRVAVG